MRQNIKPCFVNNFHVARMPGAIKPCMGQTQCLIFSDRLMEIFIEINRKSESQSGNTATVTHIFKFLS